MSRTRNTPARLSRAVWACRIAFAAVFAVNVQCALGFVFAPDSFAGAYELSGVPGLVAVQGMGVAFLMWNATYPAFIVQPRRFKPLGAVILAQQAVGLLGETAILAGLDAAHAVLAQSIARFIAFDAFGLVVMACAFALLLRASVCGQGPSSQLRR